MSEQNLETRVANLEAGLKATSCLMIEFFGAAAKKSKTVQSDAVSSAIILSAQQDMSAMWLETFTSVFKTALANSDAIDPAVSQALNKAVSQLEFQMDQQRALLKVNLNRFISNLPGFDAKAQMPLPPSGSDQCSAPS